LWSDSVPTRLSILVTLMLAALPLGCGGRVEMALVDPDKYRFHTCAQLARDMTKLRVRSQELRALYDKATRDSPLVARAAYEADYLSTVGDMQLIEAAAQERNCDPPVIAAVNASVRQ
jgi:hypothetical protein